MCEYPYVKGGSPLSKIVFTAHTNRTGMLALQLLRDLSQAWDQVAPLLPFPCPHVVPCLSILPQDASYFLALGVYFSPMNENEPFMLILYPPSLRLPVRLSDWLTVKEFVCREQR